MMMRWFVWTPVCLLLWLPPSMAEAAARPPGYLTEIAAGFSVRDSLRNTGAMDGVGPALHLDFGRHLGHNFFLLGSLGWARGSGPEADEVDSLNAALSIRWALSFPRFEIFCQMGLGGLVDLISLKDPASDEAAFELNRQLAFAGSIGFDLRIAGDVFVGLRCDSLLGDELVRANFAAFAGYRY